MSDDDDDVYLCAKRGRIRFLKWYILIIGSLSIFTLSFVIAFLKQSNGTLINFSVFVAKV